MKVVYLILLSTLSVFVSLRAQPLALWPATTSSLEEARVFSADITALDLERGNGLGVLSYSGSGVSAANWATELNDDVQADFYQFGIVAGAGKTVAVDAINLKERRSSSGPSTFVVVYSKDNFRTEKVVATVNLPDDINIRTHSFPLAVKISDGESLNFRLYAYGAESNSGSWNIRANSLELIGSVMDACTAPTTLGNVSIMQLNETSVEINFAGGDGQGRMLVVAPVLAEESAPYQGESYIGNTTYGLGDRLGDATHVITSTSSMNSTITIDGLEAGGIYQLSVFEYNVADMCYADEPLRVEFATNCPSIPSVIKAMRISALDGQVALRWEGPPCFDKYLLVASENPITGSPQSTIFDHDTDYGESVPSNGFGAGEYPVFYAGNRNDIIIEGLSNGTTYHFAAFTRVGSDWSTAYNFTATPEEACPRIYPERIFINELHYRNAVINQDQGVEIAGPAGIDLSNYEMVVFQRIGNLNNFIVEVYRTDLRGMIDDEGTGMGAIWFSVPLMPQQRGLVTIINKVTEESVDFVQYDPGFGIRDILSGPINSLGPANPSLMELPSTPAGFSLQRVGEGSCPSDFQWLRLPHSRGILNAGQALLPVQLTLLAAEAKGTAARVYWQTASEQNSDHFLLERSKDGREFELLDKIAAAGNSQQLIDYEYYDYQPYAGINYYRLRQVDFDGTTYDQGIVTVNFEGDIQPGLAAFPNPVVDRSTISWSNQAETLRLSDAQGRVLRTLALDTYATGGAHSLDLSNLPAGLYFVHLESREGVETIKLLKK